MAKVKITRDICEHLVLLLIRDLGIPAGGRVLQDTLVERWDATGLRSDDLSRGVQALQNKGQLREFDFETLELTPAGHKRMYSMRLSSMSTAVAAKRALSAAAKLHAEEADAGASYVSGQSAERRE